MHIATDHVCRPNSNSRIRLIGSKSSNASRRYGASKSNAMRTRSLLCSMHIPKTFVIPIVDLPRSVFANNKGKIAE